MWHVSRVGILLALALSPIATACKLKLIAPEAYSARGTAGVAGGGDAELATIALSVDPVYPAHGANWMDYVKNDGADPYSATDSACTGAETDFSDCLHGGEMRKVVVTGVSSCAGLSLTDSLGVFQWSCAVSAGVATFYSTGFQSGTGLKDLVNASGWKSASVTLSGARRGSSSPALWWNNPVNPLPDNSALAASVVDLDGITYPSGSIMTLAASRATYGYNISADRIALVTLGGAVLSYNGNAAQNCNGGDHCIVLGGANFSWFEGTFDGVSGGATDADHGFYLHNTKFNRFNALVTRNDQNCGFYLGPTSTMTMTGVTILGAGNYSLYSGSGIDHSFFQNITIKNGSNGFALMPGNDNVVRHLRLGNNLGTGILLSNANNNRIFDTVIFGGGEGVYIDGTSSGNLISQIAIASSGNNGITIPSVNATSNVVTQALIQGPQYGIQVTGGKRNVFAMVTIANIYDQAIWLKNGSNQNTFHQLSAVNNRDAIVFGGATNSVSNTFSQIAALDNRVDGIDLSNRSDSSKFTGTLVVGNNGPKDCVQSGGTNPGLSDTTCTTGGTDGSNSYTAGYVSNAVLRTGRTSALSFVGKLTSADPANASNDSMGGASAFPVSPATFDFTTFSNFFRLWGVDGSAYPNSDHADGWTAGAGKIWDWRLLMNGAALWNRSGDGSATNQGFVSGGPCPAEADGNRVAVDQAPAAHTYLLNAVEIVDPSATGYITTGNHNGLCESNESCLYTPNYGAYQGHGALGTCVPSYGAVTGFTLWGYGSNGI